MARAPASGRARRSPPLRRGAWRSASWRRGSSNNLGAAGWAPTAPGRPGLRAGRAALGRGRGEQVTAVAAAERDARAALENDDRVPMEPRLHLAHAVEVDERGPADPPEPLRIHSRLERGESGTHGVHAVAGVQSHIVARRFDPVHLSRPDEETAAVVHDEQAFRVAAGGRLLCTPPRRRRVELPQPGLELRGAQAVPPEIATVIA